MDINQDETTYNDHKIRFYNDLNGLRIIMFMICTPN